MQLSGQMLKKLRNSGKEALLGFLRSCARPLLPCRIGHGEPLQGCLCPSVTHSVQAVLWVFEFLPGTFKELCALKNCGYCLHLVQDTSLVWGESFSLHTASKLFCVCS